MLKVTNINFKTENNTISLNPIEIAKASTMETRNSGGTEGILDKERKLATFIIEQMTNYLDGGIEKTKRKRFIRSPTEGIIFNDKFNWSRAKMLEEHVKLFIEVHKKWVGKIKPSREDISYMLQHKITFGAMNMHFSLFMPTIQGMASDEQNNWWYERCLHFKMIGCYAQTELGHGSNVRGLETIAEYDKETEEFVLNTPTLKSMKFWPGGLGKVCTHAAVYAQLLIDGKEYGVHVFMLQIRDENHRPMPGIELGDLGSKMGDEANDTGFMRLENVRIPRDFLFSRHQEVTKDGKYLKKGRNKNDKLHYATMMYTRGSMTKHAGEILAQAATIATRYNCIRKQGFIDSDAKVSYLAPEVTLMDYQIQNYRIMKQISISYAILISGSWLINRFKELTGESTSGGAINYKITNVDVLPEIASTTAGLKALSTLMCSDGVEDLRKCCGGVGYLLSSGIAVIQNDNLWRVTAEGDMIILQLQTARMLIKSYQQVMKSNNHTDELPKGPYSYIADIKAKKSANVLKFFQKPQDFLNLDYLERLFQYHAMMSVSGIGESFEEKLKAKGGSSFDTVWNEMQVELIEATKIHTCYFMFKSFNQFVKDATLPTLQTVLHDLCCLFGLSFIIEQQWAGILNFNHVNMARNCLQTLLQSLRPNAVALVDAFDIPDRVLCSAIGSYDGNVYEALFEAAKNSELNRQDPFDGYDYMRQFLDLEYLKKGNSLPSSTTKKNNSKL